LKKQLINQITIAGTIAAGKSTLREKFGAPYLRMVEPIDEDQHLDWWDHEAQVDANNPYRGLEEVDGEPRLFIEKNPYLIDFGKNPAGNTPLMECYLLARHRIEYEAMLMSHRPIVSDWGFPATFAKILFSDGIFGRRDYDNFLACERVMSKYLPSLIIVLVGAETAYRRNKKRARECEAQLPLSYFVRLEEEILDHCGRLASRHGVVVREIDCNNIGLVGVRDILVENSLPPIEVAP